MSLYNSAMDARMCAKPWQKYVRIQDRDDPLRGVVAISCVSWLSERLHMSGVREES